MNEHIALLEKEIREIEINLARAKARPGVNTEELFNLERKLRLKSDICSVIKELLEEGEIDMKEKYAIQAKRKNDDMRWTPWSFTDDYDEAIAHKKYCESVGYVARIVEDGKEEEAEEMPVVNPAEWAYDMWCLGYTQQQIGDAMGVCKKTVGNMLRGKTRIRPKLVYNA